jgi:primosomal protein N' (replication factor Y) (superfamily II helicase)
VGGRGHAVVGSCVPWALEAEQSPPASPFASGAPGRFARMPRVVDVALALPLFRTFSYLPPREGMEIAPGSRVVVPFRNRRAVGVALGTRDVPEGERAWKAILAVPDAEPAIGPALLATAQWIASHYVAPMGVVLRAALPVQLTSAAAPTPAGKRQRVVVLHRRLDSLMERDALFKRTPKQRVVYEHLEANGDRATVATLHERLDVGDGVLRAMAQRGLVRLEQEGVLRDPFALRAAAPAPTLEPTEAQQAAVARIVQAAPGEVILLHGVTGSGKTLVYLEVLRRVLADPAASAIVLVPEIALTPQTVARFRAWFGDQVAVLHSALSDGERLDAWRVLQRGERRIAVGARSAIFAPLSNVRVIVVDEEHEASYKQAEAPRYHARDVAMVRARREGAVVVLGSATPSLESWHHAQEGRHVLVSLPDRVGGGALPSVAVVDLRGPRPPAAPTPDGARVPAPPQEPVERDPFRRVVSKSLEQGLRDRLERGEQSILLLNRRGYASFLQCASCGDVAACPNCSISLTLHRAPERLACHYCGHHEDVHLACRRCHSPTVRHKGLGTQQVERLLGERLPTARIARMDLDTTSGKWAHADILDRVGRGEVDILLGTQMIAKGLDFPGVTLVGVIDADVGINLPDFRAAERTFQLLAQVAGRAGRSVKPGHVIVQTRMPDHHAVVCAVTHDYLSFVERELEDRRAPAYPPMIRLANVVISGLDEAAVAAVAQSAASWLQRLVENRGLTGVRLIGPAPSPIARIKSRYRWHLLLKSADGKVLTNVLRFLAERFDVPDRHELRLSIDRDPVTLL